MPPRREPPPLEDTVASLAEQITRMNSQFAEDRNALQQQLRDDRARSDAALASLSTKSDASLTTMSTTLADSLSTITESMTNLQHAIVQLTPPNTGSPQYVEHPSSSGGHRDPTTFHMRQRPPEPLPHPAALKPPRIALAAFDGANPLDWLFQAEQYFTLYHVPEDERLAWVSFHMHGEALSWYKHLHDNHLLRDWRSFTRDLELRFEPSSFDNHQASLFKLRQHGTVAEFQAAFEQLDNCVVDLPLEALKNCFISGLRNDIQRELAVLRPRTLTEAMGQAKLLEAKLQDARNKQLSFSPRSAPSFRSPPATPAASGALPTTPITLALPPPQFKHLSPDELRYKREHGLSFGCFEKFHAGHKCKQNHFLILAPTHHPISPTTTVTLPKMPPHLCRIPLICLSRLRCFPTTPHHPAFSTTCPAPPISGPFRHKPYALPATSTDTRSPSSSTPAVPIISFSPALPPSLSSQLSP